MRLFWKLYIALTGWKTIGRYPSEIKKGVLLIAPHTSNWDLLTAVAFRSKERIKAKYLGKKELFRFPFGFIFRWLGGYPVDRGKAGNLVEATVDIFNSKDQFIIGIAPEGTRKKVKKLKTGFYHIAKKASVPILMVAFDYEKKAVIYAEPLYPTDNQKADFKVIHDFYKDVKGKNPELGLMDIGN